MVSVSGEWCLAGQSWWSLVTGSTVAQHCVKSDTSYHWEGTNFDLTQNRWTDCRQNLVQLSASVKWLDADIGFGWVKPHTLMLTRVSCVCSGTTRVSSSSSSSHQQSANTTTAATTTTTSSSSRAQMTSPLSRDETLHYARNRSVCEWPAESFQ